MRKWSTIERRMEKEKEREEEEEEEDDEDEGRRRKSVGGVGEVENKLRSHKSYPSFILLIHARCLSAFSFHAIFALFIIQK
jgi:hypothetical protein